MKFKNSFSSAFTRLFISIPLLVGSIGLIIYLSIGDQIFSASTASEGKNFLAGVFPEANQVPDGNLPQGNIESDFLPAIIDILLALTSTVVLGVMLTSGALYIVHFGDEEKLTTAKSLFKWGATGTLVIVIAYAIIQGVVALTLSRT